MRGGPGPGQRRPRPAGRLLPGLAGDARASGDRLRHPLRVRHLRAGDRRRLAGRAPRQLAASSATPGRSPARRQLPGEVAAATSSTTPTTPAHDRVRWVPDGMLMGVAYDIAHRRATATTPCNTLPLWSARAVESFDLQVFNEGDYGGRRGEDDLGEHLQGALPQRRAEAGKRLRLKQQYFFVACSMQHVRHIMDDLADAGVRDASPSESRSSSTTRTRRSPSPS